MNKRQYKYLKILTARIAFLVSIFIYAFSLILNSQGILSKPGGNDSQETDSKISDINNNIEPDFVEIVNFYGKNYYKIYMSPEKLCRKYNPESIDLDKYKGYYYQEVQIIPDIKEIADSLKLVEE